MNARRPFQLPEPEATEQQRREHAHRLHGTLMSHVAALDDFIIEWLDCGRPRPGFVPLPALELEGIIVRLAREIRTLCRSYRYLSEAYKPGYFRRRYQELSQC